MSHRHLKFIAGTFALAALAGPALAQGYPNKPIELQVPFAPGGTTDIVARIISEPLGKSLGQSVIVVNKPGGGGIVGAAETARATSASPAMVANAKVTAMLTNMRMPAS